MIQYRPSMAEALQRSLLGLGDIGTAIQDNRKTQSDLLQSAAVTEGVNKDNAAKNLVNQTSKLSFDKNLKKQMLLESFKNSQPASQLPMGETGKASLGMDAGGMPTGISASGAQAQGLNDAHYHTMSLLNDDPLYTPEMAKADYAGRLTKTQNETPISNANVTHTQAQARTSGVEANIAEKTQGDKITQSQNETAASAFKPLQAKANVGASNAQAKAMDNGQFSFFNGGDGSVYKTNTKKGTYELTDIAGKVDKNAEFNALPMEAQEQVKKIAGTIGFQKTLKNTISSDLEQFKNAKTKDAALSYGLGMLKAMNSSLGPDALSNDEAERLASELKYQVGNWSGSGEFIGRNLDKFVDKVNAKINSMQGSIDRGNADIDSLYGRTPKTDSSSQKAPAAPSAGTVEGGYKFKGGDPKDPKNWEKV